MSNNAVGQVARLLQTLVVLAHLAWCPGIIAGDSLDATPVTVVWIYSDEGVVNSAASKRANTRVQNTQGFGTGRRVRACVASAISKLICKLGVLLHLRFVVEVLDEVVPSHRLVFSGNRVQDRHIVLSSVGLVVTSFKKEDLVTIESQSGCERCTASTRADNDIFVILKSGGVGSTHSTLDIQSAVRSVFRAIDDVCGSEVGE